MKTTIAAIALLLSSTLAVAAPRSYIVADGTGLTISKQNSQEVRSIASITKLMAALLAAEQDQAELLDIPTRRTVATTIPAGVRQLSRKELLTLSLVRSDNFAAQILCNNLDDCVNKMNVRAQSLGMAHTVFVEPTGLDKRNVSTADDLVKLVMASMAIDIIAELSSMPGAEIEHSNGTFRVKNTNPLTATQDVVVSKTGYTRPAGGCLVMVVNSNEGQRIFVLLGSKNTRTRVTETEQLLGLK